MAMGKLTETEHFVSAKMPSRWADRRLAM